MYILAHKDADVRGISMGIHTDGSIWYEEQDPTCGILHVQTLNNVAKNKWTSAIINDNGTGKASGINIWINGTKQKLLVQSDTLSSTCNNIQVNQPWNVASYRGLYINDYIGSLDEIQIFDSYVSPLKN
jgi:hypothetical protein